MKVLFDTSILVPALIARLPNHHEAASLLLEAIHGEIDLHVSTHSLAETFATITTLPLSPRLTPGQASELIRVNISDRARVVSLASKDYRLAIDRMVGLGVSGRAIYDLLHVRAAEKVKVDRLYTFNGRDFRRFPPRPPTDLVVL